MVTLPAYTPEPGRLINNDAAFASFYQLDADVLISLSLSFGT